MIDNQQVKYKISILFFWLVDRLPLLSPAFVGGGGWDQKTAARPGRFRGGGPSRTTPAYPAHPIPVPRNTNPVQHTPLISRANPTQEIPRTSVPHSRPHPSRTKEFPGDTIPMAASTHIPEAPDFPHPARFAIFAM